MNYQVFLMAVKILCCWPYHDLILGMSHILLGILATSDRIILMPPEQCPGLAMHLLLLKRVKAGRSLWSCSSKRTLRRFNKYNSTKGKGNLTAERIDLCPKYSY